MRYEVIRYGTVLEDFSSELAADAYSFLAKGSYVRELPENKSDLAKLKIRYTKDVNHLKERIAGHKSGKGWYLGNYRSDYAIKRMEQIDLPSLIKKRKRLDTIKF